jgi:enterobacterial common antigen flippase
MPPKTMASSEEIIAPALGAAEAGLAASSCERPRSYSQILKSSALIGGASVLKIGLGIVRAKAMAVLLGPAGFGLMGLYSSIADLTQSIASMGINSSGVRQIAAAVGSGETARIAQTAMVLRRTARVLGVLGGLLLIVFCRQVSFLTFGTYERAGAVAWLSLAVLFGSIAGGQTALIQGMRRISDLAMMGVLGALFGTVMSIPLVYFFREQGVVPSLISVAAMAILTSWWYSRKVEVQAPAMTGIQVKQEAAALLKLGFAFMASGILMMGAAYAIRIMVVRKLGLEAAGLYQSAWTLGGLYVGFILQAMGADFYPRLTAVAKDDQECNHLVNEQAQVSLLLAGPGVIATLTFAPLVIALFYSARFGEAVPILRWLCFGTVLQVIAWPMGFIVLAKGAQKIYFWTELTAAVVQVVLAWFLVAKFGLAGAGAAFFGLYVWHGLLIYLVVRRLSGFRWSAATRRMGFFLLCLIASVFSGFYVFPFWLANLLGIAATLVSGVYSLRMLLHLVSSDRIPHPVRRLLVWLRFAPPK